MISSERHTKCGFSAKTRQATFEMLLYQLENVQFMHPSSHPLLALHRLALERSLSPLVSLYQSKRYKRASHFAQQLIAGLEGVLPYGHPVRAVQQTVLARLMSIGSDGEEIMHHAQLLGAHAQLKKASGELRVAFGPNSILLDKLRGEIISLERDLDMRMRLHIK